MDLFPDFKEFLQLLNAERVDYLVGGGYAVTWHGYPRFTGDIDIWIHATEENSQKMMRVLDAFGAGGMGIGPADFLDPRMEVLTMGTSPVRIDMMTQMKGLRFEEAFARKEIHDSDGTPVFILGLADLRRAKLAANRPKDQDDLLHLPTEEEASNPHADA
jgi:hypothetical protein